MNYNFISVLSVRNIIDLLFNDVPNNNDNTKTKRKSINKMS